MRIVQLAAAGAVMLGAPPATGELVRRDASGFVSEHRVTIAATPDRVWSVLVAPQRWWNASHTYSGDAANLSLDLRAGGCWCEKLAGGGAVEHMRVVYFEPGRVLRMRGSLGPLQEGAVTGTMTVTLTPGGNGTELTVRYVVGGYMADGLTGIAGPVDQVLGGQFDGLARRVNGG
ncbi:MULTISPECIES: SRPBCC family protein [unclassified Sphingomonas]|uniref:SRPBCC family protein n=1 Tax=unclassified Sphingomonas TaxID=196159 RepID=UPI000832E2FC|nr:MULTISPECIES: SRPBCC domain-containing protein [unclassified Sphingomonas]